MLNPVLSAVQKIRVRDIWNDGSNDKKILVKAFTYEITGASLKTCKEEIWLNDEVGNLFIFSVCLDSLFLTLGYKFLLCNDQRAFQEQHLASKGYGLQLFLL